MGKPPILDRLDTRRLERREVLRSFVQGVQCEEAGERSLFLSAAAAERHRHAAVQVSDAPIHPRSAFAARVRIDVCGDGVFRVRYAEGDDVPENITAMVVGELPAAAQVEILETEEGWTLESGSARLVVEKSPFLIRLEDANGRCLAEIGGREKNHFGNWDAYPTGICRTTEGRPLAVECFALRPHEAVYGFGEQFTRLDKVGQTVDLNMEEPFGTGTVRTYKNVPFFMTTRGYGVFLNHSCRMTAWVGSRSAPDIQLALEDDFLDYYLFAGDLKTILGNYTALTGRPTPPPRWSFGYWQSKISYASADEALDVVRRLRAADVPLDVLHVDTHWFDTDWYCDLEFAKDRFPDPAGFIAELASMGVKLSLWQLPYIPEGSRLFDELAKADGFVKNEAGEIYDIGVCHVPGFEGRVGCIDLTSPGGRRVYGDALRRLFEMGARVIKADFGEEAPLDGIWHDGSPSHRMHNLYPLLYNRFVTETTEEATGERILWGRSAWAGSQQYPVHWGGDSSTNWHSLAPQMQGGLSLGLSGFTFWSQDIGGFLGQTSGDLLIRWMQAGLFLSHSRIHGFGHREIDRFDAETFETCRNLINLRYRLLPYIWAEAERCAAEGLPMARAMVLDFEADPNTWPLADQWMFGESLLVAPIMDASGARDVYLPEGVWRDWWSGERHDGGRWLATENSIDTFPLFIREGSIVPLGPEMSYVGERPIDEITLRIAPFERAGESRIDVSVDDGTLSVRYAYRNEEHTLEYDAGSIRIEIDDLGSGILDTARK